MKNKGILFIFLLLIILFLVNIFEASGVTTHNGNLTVDMDYITAVGETFHITGNLKINPGKVFMVSENSTLIVDGNLTVGESGNTNEAELYLLEGCKVLIKGNAYFGGGSLLGWGLLPHMSGISGSDAEIVIEGDVTSWKSKGVDSDDVDIYVFGSGGNIIDNSKNQSDFNGDYPGGVDSYLSKEYSNICYILKKPDNSDFELCTDADGDIIIDLDDAGSPFNLNGGSGLLTIPDELTIKCNNFIIRGDGEPNGSSNTGIVCRGRIECSGDFKLENVGHYWEGSRSYFWTECTSTIIADDILIQYVYGIQPFKGNWVSNSLSVKNGNGQDVDFDGCSYVKSNEITIDANISNGVIIEGHIIADNVTSSKDIYIKYSGTADDPAILTIGALESVHSYNNVKLIADENSIINLCSNPTQGDGTFDNQGQYNEQPNGADRIGYFKGIVLYNYGTGGWENTNLNPQDEWDINPQKNQWGNTDGYTSYTVKKIVAAYDGYANCINEVNMDSFLPIELTYFKITDGNFEWETKSETNNDYFIIEYSKNGTDWTECTDHIQSQSNTGWIYSYPVPETTKGSVFSYYRLKQVDLDGTFSYSDILSTSWKVPTPPQPKAGYTKAFIGVDGKIIYDNYNQLPSGVYIEKSENGTRRIVKLK